MDLLFIGEIQGYVQNKFLFLNTDSLNLYLLYYKRKMDSPPNLSVNYLNLLPDELLEEILLKTDDLKTLSRLCQTSKRINIICQD